MDSATRLKLAARISYYLGGVLALCGAIEHFGVGAGLLRSIDLSQRNLFEGSVMLLLFSAVSAIRAVAASNPN